jgi:kinesin family protein 4/21/27
MHTPHKDSSDEELTVQGSDSSDESEEELDDSASLASNVADLSSEINLKEQLVDQLEKAQRNLQVMKQQYEDKMSLLQTQIRGIESERDKVLKDISSQRSKAGGVSPKDVKARYEKQLLELRAELKTLKLAKKEHSKAMKKNAQNENELRRLKADLLEMKKARVKLLYHMRAEASRWVVHIGHSCTTRLCQARACEPLWKSVLSLELIVHSVTSAVA